MVGQTPDGQKPRLLVVGAGPFQVELLRAAQQLCELVVADGSGSAPGLALADDPHVIDVRDLDAIVALAKRANVHGVLTSASDVAVPAVSAVVDRLGLIGLPSVVSERCRDKLQAFQALKSAGLAVPATLAVSTLDEAEAAIDALGGFPVVIKPRSGGGGRGVSMVHDRTELIGAVQRALASYVGSDQRKVLVQERILGRSLGVESFFVEGQLRAAFVLDDQFDERYVSPIGHSVPPEITAAMHEAVVQASEAFGAALGITTSAVNFDLRVDRGRVFLIEANPRLGGNSITALIEHGYGALLSRAAVLCALGRDPSPALTRKHVQPVAGRLLLKQGRGIARIAADVNDLGARADVLALDFTVRDGELTSTHVDGLCLLGRCIVKGKSGNAAAESARKLAREITEQVRIEPTRSELAP